MSGENGNIHAFKGLTLDAERKVLWRDGEIVKLPLKAVELLAVLLRNRGQVVSKEELLDQIWGSTVVEESNLTNNIYVLRRTLGELTGSDDLIETVPRRGYRFGRNLDKDPALVLEHHVFEETLRQETELGPLPSIRRIRSHISIALTCLLLLGVAGFGVWQYNQNALNPRIRSIAVLPFNTIGGAPVDEHRGMALADILITRLTNIKGLNVRPTSAVIGYSGTDALSAGEKLGTEAILEGTIFRTDEKVRITARLLNVADKVPIWAGEFEKLVVDELAMQDELALQLIDALAVNLSGIELKRVTKRYTDDAAAFDLYQKARFHWNKRSNSGMREAERLFRNAIAKDPKFTLAYVGLADTVGMSGNPGDAFESVNAALQLDPELGEAHATLGFLLTFHSWEWDKADASLRKAIELNPNYATAHHWHAQLLAIRGRHEKAKAAMLRALDINPLSHNLWADLGQIYYFNRENEGAKAHVRRSLEISPNFLFAHEYLARIYLQTGETDASVESFFNAQQALHGIYPAEAGRNELRLQHAKRRELYRSGGLRALYLDYLEAIESSNAAFADRNPDRFLGAAVIYAFLGDNERALDRLEEAFRSRAFMIVFIKADPVYDPLRNEPRFRSILQRMNL